MDIAAALEAHSIHPVARAFHAGAKRAQATEVVAHASGGLVGVVGGRRWCIGSAGFVGEWLGQRIDSSRSGEIWLADEQGWCATFRLTDAMRPGVQPVLEYLAARGLDVRILSGDEAGAVAAVAQRLGIASWFAQQRAEEKLHFIRDLQEKGKTVLMVGDGANDGPVLAAADVSITVQGATELANSTADLILTTESLRPLLRALDISRKSARLIRQNLVWALSYNAAVLPLAMSGILQPWMAALGMSASSLLVVLNAARLVGFRKTRRAYAAPALEVQLQ
jgi:Cu2+-exporting ATPase